MSDLLAVIGSEESDADVLAAVTYARPSRVTLLVSSGDGELIGAENPQADALRDRLARLMAAVERDTGATVIGLAGDRAQLAGWRFDREVAAPEPVAV